MVDLFDTDDFATKPDWWTSDEAAMERIFGARLVEWQAAGQWFVQVPAGVKAGASHSGTDYADERSYINPDNTYADGTEAPPPDDPPSP